MVYLLHEEEAPEKVSFRPGKLTDVGVCVESEQILGNKVAEVPLTTCKKRRIKAFFIYYFTNSVYT